jgi:hypothetical protein
MCLKVPPNKTREFPYDFCESSIKNQKLIWHVRRSGRQPHSTWRNRHKQDIFEIVNLTETDGTRINRRLRLAPALHCHPIEKVKHNKDFQPHLFVPSILSHSNNEWSIYFCTRQGYFFWQVRCFPFVNVVSDSDDSSHTPADSVNQTVAAASNMYFLTWHCFNRLGQQMQEIPLLVRLRLLGTTLPRKPKPRRATFKVFLLLHRKPWTMPMVIL